MTFAPARRVQAIHHSFGTLPVLRGVTFDVLPGSVFALLGANGAGKTTLIKILATLLRADAGTAQVAGFDVARDAAAVREVISLTGQFAAVDDVLSGRENLKLIAKLRHATHPGKSAQHLLERFSLADRIAILHEGVILANGTLAELRALLPPAKVTLVEQQPTLERVFLAVTGHNRRTRVGGGSQ